METNTLHNFLISNSPEYVVMVSDYWLNQEAPLRAVQTLVSIVFFAGPHADTKLVPLPSPLIPAETSQALITAGEHVQNKIAKTAQ